MKKPPPVVSHHTPPHATPAGYVVGFSLSLYLTIVAYWLTVHRSFDAYFLGVAIITLALMQFCVQAWFFLHIGRESRPRWNLLIFSFMVLAVAIIVIGSLWIMANLDYHHSLSPADTNQEIIKDEGVQR